MPLFQVTRSPLFLYHWTTFNFSLATKPSYKMASLSPLLMWQRRLPEGAHGPKSSFVVSD